MNPPRIRTSNAQKQTMQPNPQSGRAELLARIRELREENDDLQSKLDRIAGLAEAPEDECDEGYDELVDKLNDIVDVLDDEDEDDQGNG